MNSRKLTGLFFIFFYFANAFANEKPDETKLFNSSYVGVSAGFLATKNTLSSTASATYTGAWFDRETTSTANASTRSNTSFAGSLFLGTKDLAHTKKLYFNAELFSTIADRTNSMSLPVGPFDLRAIFFEPISVELANLTTSKQNTFDLGADVRLGYYLLPQAIIYFKTGPVVNRAKVTTSTVFYDTDNNLNPPGSTTSTLYNTTHQTLAGIVLGIGSEIATSRHLHVSLDAAYTAFSPNIKISSTGDTTSPQNRLGERNVVIANGLTNHTSVKNIQNISAFLGIKYYA